MWCDWKPSNKTNMFLLKSLRCCVLANVYIQIKTVSFSLRSVSQSYLYSPNCKPYGPNSKLKSELSDMLKQISTLLLPWCNCLWNASFIAICLLRTAVPEESSLNRHLPSAETRDLEEDPWSRNRKLPPQTAHQVGEAGCTLTKSVPSVAFWARLWLATGEGLQCLSPHLLWMPAHRRAALFKWEEAVLSVDPVLGALHM